MWLHTKRERGSLTSHLRHWTSRQTLMSKAGQRQWFFEMQWAGSSGLETFVQVSVFFYEDSNHPLKSSDALAQA